jgi:glutamate transport system ATP-binding protein
VLSTSTTGEITGFQGWQRAELEGMVTMSEPLVVIDRVNKHFGELHVLKDITATIHRGEVVVVIGPSGSGKSTLCRAINRLETIDSGTIMIDGKHLPEEGKDLAKLRADVGMVFQSFNLFAHKTVLENLIEAPMLVAGKSKDESVVNARRLLERVGLAEKADVFPGSLSGGQQQRAAIARTLAMQPEVLLFDEPTSSLDPETTGEVLSVMAELAQTGMTMIVVTHEMSFARKVSDRVVMMENGVVQYEAEPNEFFEAQDNERLRAFLSSME